MVATMTPAPVSRSKTHSVRRPVQKHKVANSEEFKAKEHERSRRDRISVVVGLVAGAGLVYSMTTASVEAAEDRITSSDAWQELCATNPERCAELEKIIADQLRKVKNQGKFEGMGTGTLLLLAAGLGGMLWLKNR